MSTPSNPSPRVSLGISGLDEILHGGIPRGRLFLIEGEPGTGKTTLALRFLLQAAKDGESCLLVSNAESPGQLEEIAASHGWTLDGIHIREWRAPGGGEEVPDSEYTLFSEAEVEAGETLEHFFAEVDALSPTLLVIDSISALRALAPTPAYYRRQYKRIRDFLASRGCTAIVLDDASRDAKDARARTLSDGILELRQIDFNYGNDRRQLRVRKLRGATYVSGVHDFTIVSGGLEVYPRLVAKEHTRLTAGEPASSGIERLDALAGGGLPRGTSTLIFGPAGTGKSTIASAYVNAAAQRGERSSVLLFDEHPESFIARSAGLGIDVSRALETGLVSLSHLDPAVLSPGQIANFLVRQVEEEDVQVVVIDTLNGYLQSALEESIIMLHLRELVSFLARRQVVTMITLTEHGVLGAESNLPIDISLLVDNVFLLRYFEMAGSIRQAISMVKKRVGPHERTIRELQLGPDGIGLSDALGEFTGVLGGTPRYAGSALS